MHLGWALFHCCVSMCGRGPKMSGFDDVWDVYGRSRQRGWCWGSFIHSFMVGLNDFEGFFQPKRFCGPGVSLFWESWEHGSIASSLKPKSLSGLKTTEKKWKVPSEDGEQRAED